MVELTTFARRDRGEISADFFCREFILPYICKRNSIQMSTKIKQLQRQSQETPVLFSAWLEQQGLTRSELADFVRRNWLRRVANGVYCFDGYTPTLYAVLYSYHKLLDKKYVLGASTALGLRGFSHYGYVGDEPIFLYEPTGEHIPKWLRTSVLFENLQVFSTNLFSGSELGIDLLEVEGYEVFASSPERAILEALSLSPRYYSLMDLFYVTEMLATLRPKLLQELLELSRSVKVNRLLLYFADKAQLPWFKQLDTSKINIGKGNRALATPGVYVEKYQITVPQELYDYE